MFKLKLSTNKGLHNRVKTHPHCDVLQKSTVNVFSLLALWFTSFQTFYSLPLKYKLLFKKNRDVIDIRYNTVLVSGVQHDSIFVQIVK